MTCTRIHCLMKMWLVCLLFTLFSSSRQSVDCFSVSPPPPTIMTKKAQRRAMNSIWHYTKHGRYQNPYQALKLLEKLLLQEEQNGSHHDVILKPGVVWNVLNACRQTPLLLNESHSSFLDRLERSILLLQNNPRLYQVNMTEFVLSTLIQQNQHQRAQVILERHSDMLLSLPTSWKYSQCLSAKNAIWFHLNHSSRSTRSASAEYALRLLERLLLPCQDCQALVVSKGMVVNVLGACRREGIYNVDTLERLLVQLQDRNLLDAKLFNQVLQSMTLTTRGLARAETLVKANSTLSNIHHYCTVLNGHAQRGHAKKAEQLLQGMMEKGMANNSTVAYNIVLHALCMCDNQAKLVERAEALWKKMKATNDTQPDFISYTTVLNLYSKYSMGDQAETLLQQMLLLEMQPNERHYRCVIHALSKSGQAERAQVVLKSMKNHNVRPNQYHYCGVLNGYARQGQPLQAERILTEMIHDIAPNIVAYNCVMFAWTKSGEVDAPFRAKALLDQMMETKGVTPNRITYNCLLGACAGRAMAKETEKLLKQMQELYECGDLNEPPNVISYNYVLDSLARSGDRVWTVARAETLINTMMELHKAGQADTRPNMISYRSLLKCYSNWNLPLDAEKLLSRMQELHETGELEYGPDRVSYRVVIDALSKSDDDEARDRGKGLRKEMEERYGQQSWQEETVIDMGDPQLDALLEYMRE